MRSATTSSPQVDDESQPPVFLHSAAFHATRNALVQIRHERSASASATGKVMSQSTANHSLDAHVAVVPSDGSTAATAVPDPPLPSSAPVVPTGPRRRYSISNSRLLFINLPRMLRLPCLYMEGAYRSYCSEQNCPTPKPLSPSPSPPVQALSGFFHSPKFHPCCQTFVLRITIHTQVGCPSWSVRTGFSVHKPYRPDGSC
jgi:hypothetical protein